MTGDPVRPDTSLLQAWGGEALNASLVPEFHIGAGSPEGVVTAVVGAAYINTGGGVGTTLYIKESGAGNTGWTAIAPGGGGGGGGGAPTTAEYVVAIGDVGLSAERVLTGVAGETSIDNATAGQSKISIAPHLAASDPHPQYATDTDLTAHVAASDPHPGYATDADLAAHVAAGDPHPQYSTDADLAAHVAAGDPHTQYTLDTDFNTHVADLDAGGHKTVDQEAALAGTNGTPSAANKYVTDSDPRNTDARVPLISTPSDGDLIVRSGGAWVRFPKGTASQEIRMNAGATAPEWYTPAAGGASVAALAGVVGGIRRGATANRWTMAGSTAATAVSTQAVSAGRLYAFPIWVPRLTGVDRIGINVSTAGVAGTLARVGIYADDGNGYPGALVAGTDVATIATSALGGPDTLSNAMPAGTNIGPGLYWFALVCSGTPTLRGPATSALWPLLGTDGAAATTAPGTGWFVAFPFAALPATFTAGATVNTTGVPGIYVRWVLTLP